MTWWRCYFRLFAGTVRAPQAVKFLAELRRQLRGKLLVIWDGLAVHRSRHVGQWVGRSGGAVALARLPACAPELNPVESVWGAPQKARLGQFLPQDFAHLGGKARRTLLRAQRRPGLVRAFWHQAELSL